jgi:hypothetical protein
MAFDFPNSPIDQQIYTAPTGAQYTYSATPFPGVWYQTSAAAVTGTARRDNRIINPTMGISVENGSTVMSAANSYPVDQWFINFNGLSPNIAQQLATFTSPFGTRYGLFQNFTVAKASLAATDYMINCQRLEGYHISDLGWGTPLAKPAVFRINASAGLAGIYSVMIRNAANTYTFVKGLNLTNTMQTFVFQIPAQPNGVWPTDNSTAMEIFITTACGSTYTAAADGVWNAAGSLFAVPGQVNMASTTTQSLLFTDVGLYVDPDNTGKAPPWEAPDVGTELVKCMRYFQTVVVNNRVGAGAAQNWWIAINWCSPMRTTPGLSGVVGSRLNITNVTVGGATIMSGTIQVTTTAAGDAYVLNEVWKVNARM